MESARYYAKTYLKPFLLCTFVYSLSIIYSLVVLFNIARRYYNKKDTTEFFWNVKNRPVPPACLNDPRYGNHKYIQLKNLKLHYVEAGLEDKPLMLFVHGFPEFWFSWRHQIEEFSKDYRVIAIDTRGCGDSEKPLGIKYYQTKYLVDDLKNFLDAIGQTKCILVGHDWGGVISWLFIMKYPQMVEKYIFLNVPHPLVYRKHVSSSLTQFGMSWYVLFYKMLYVPEFSLTVEDMAVFKGIFRNKKTKKMILEEDELEAYKFMFGKPGAFTFPLNYYRANFNVTSPHKELPKVEPEDYPKGLLIFGEDDAFLDAGPLVEKTKAFVPHLQTEMIPGACHFVHEEEPEKINKSMRAYLEAK